jgi:hypothetical protein
MDWATFYLICFVVGLVFSALSVLGSAGRVHLPGHWHLPRFGHHHAGPLPTAHAAGGAGTQCAGGNRGSDVSFFNFSSLMVFLAWFGGTGYLLTRYSGFWTAAAFALAAVAGTVGAGIVFLFLAKVLMAHETELDPSDFHLIGMLGKVSVTIREGGTGEMVFSQGGTRRPVGARSENGAAISKGTEVVVTRYERGIAYVRLWEELAGEQASGEGTASGQ